MQIKFKVIWEVECDINKLNGENLIKNDNNKNTNNFVQTFQVFFYITDLYLIV